MTSIVLKIFAVLGMVLRQRYQNKNYKMSPAAVLSAGKMASASPAWKQRNNWNPSHLVAAGQ